ncbi:MAG: insulinase family protein [candidate division Zixibacteria bacterium]|nr:insulinase family protein [candidate division Zixibacteria bacterium]MBU1471077.1 insulinase family protein [candidate division Zixibacteria bacterium]MBU2626471.1 insulinase family protein [candidate division Zixibacteria bacterium]
MKSTVITLISIVAILTLSCSLEKQQYGTESVQMVQLHKGGIPVVIIQVLVKSGSADDPVGKEGLARFTASLMERGSAKFSRDQIESTLQLLGTELNIRVNRETILFTCQTLKENLDQSYDILSDILLHPGFPGDEVSRLISEQQDDIDDIVEDDSRLSLAILQGSLYVGHRYAHPVPGVKSAVGTFTTSDAESFYAANFKADNIIIGIAGDYPPEFANRFREDFETLKRGFARHDRGTAIPVSGRRVVLVEKENRSQTHFRIGNIMTYDRNSPDYYPLLVANTYFGQHRESFGRLYQTIRTERGLSYGAYAYAEHFMQSGWSKLPQALIRWSPTYFSIWTYPKAENAEFAIKLALLELTKLTTGAPPEEDIEKMKQFDINHFPFMYETPEQRLTLEMEQLYSGDSAYIADYPNRIARVTAAGVFDVAKRNWSPEDYVLVAVVSDGEKFRAELLDSQTTIDYPSGATDVGLEDVDEQVKRFDLKLTENDFTILRASDLFR